MAIYPATLPGPSISNYGADPDKTFLRTEVDSGAPRQRQRYTSAPTKIQASWLFTASEMVIFRAFYKTDLFGGAGWFDAELNIGDGMMTYQARFPMPYKSRLLRGNYWEVSATLEVNAN